MIHMTESSFIFFWDFDIRRILESIIPDSSVRDSCENTYLRPDYRFLLNRLCVPYSEEKRNVLAAKLLIKIAKIASRIND